MNWTAVILQNTNNNRSKWSSTPYVVICLMSQGRWSLIIPLGSCLVTQTRRLIRIIRFIMLYPQYPYVQRVNHCIPSKFVVPLFTLPTLRNHPPYHILILRKIHIHTRNVKPQNSQLEWLNPSICSPISASQTYTNFHGQNQSGFQQNL